MASCRSASTLALLLAGWASPAVAGNDLKVDFTATVINILGDAGGDVMIGDAVDGAFTVDCDTEKVELTPITQGIHPYAVSKFQMKFPSVKVKYSESGGEVPSFEPLLVVYNNQDFLNGGDQFGFFFDPVGDAIQGAEPTRVSFGLRDDTATLYDTTDLPASLDLDDFDVAYVFVQYGGGWSAPGGGVSVVTYLDTLTVKSECDAL